MAPQNRKLFLVRLAFVSLGLVLWFGTQALLARRPAPAGVIADALFVWSGPVNLYLQTHPAAANALLIASSGIVDLLGIFLLLRSLFGATVGPFLGLLLVFLLRQICQAVVALPVPEGMIWRYPGFPSLLVTYATTYDFFFSGHTAIVVFAASELARTGRRVLQWLGIVLVVFEIAALVVLRAHYTMDIAAGVLAALWVAGVAPRVAPAVDRALARL